MKKSSFAALIFLIFLVTCGEGIKTADVRRPVITNVTLTAIPYSEIDAFYETSGTLKAKTTSLLAARTTGSVLDIKVREGDRVRAGQLLMLLDDRELAQGVAAAESGCNEAVKGLARAEQNRELAEITYNRYRNLIAEKVITQQEMDQVTTQKKVADLTCEQMREALKQAQAQLKTAQISRDYAKICAPHAGVVTEKKIEVGTLAIPGMPLLIVEDTSSYRIDAFIDQRLTGKIQTGLPVQVLLSQDATPITGKVGEVLPAVDPATRSFQVKVYLKADHPSPTLKSGLYARVFMPEGKRQTLLIPKGAIMEKGQLTGVYVVDDRKVMTYRLIRAGQHHGDRIEVLSGLRAAERIATAGLNRCVDGGMVQ